MQQEHSRSTSLEGFNVNEQDTTAVLSPISEQAEETETSSQPALALSARADRQSRQRLDQIKRPRKKSAPAG